MINKMDEQREWKNNKKRKEELQKTEERIEMYHILGQEEYLESLCHEIMEFQRT
jgi:hypothetical protein